MLAVKDVGLDQGMVNAVLEAIARGRAGFTITPLVENNGEESTAGGSVNSGPRREETPLQTRKTSGDPASTEAVEKEASKEASKEPSEEPSKEAGKGKEQEGKAVSVVSPEGGVSEGDGQEKGRAGTVGMTRAASVNIFRCTRPIDNAIMGTVVAGVSPLAEPACGKGVGGAHGSTEDALEVYGPEMEWRSTGDAMEVDDDAMAAVVEALEEAEEEGLTLVQLKQVVRKAARANGAPAEEERVRSFVGSVLRNGTIVGVCGAHDVRYVVVFIFAWDRSSMLPAA